MFTVCPKCALTLVVTAEDLRVAQGYVRCGRCSSVFNALARLTEERLPEPAAPAITREAAAPRPPTDTPERPALAPSALDDDSLPEDDVIPEDALEFDPTRTDVSQVFLEAKPSPEWTAATGTFKAMLAANQEATQAAADAAPAEALPAAPPPADSEADIDLELDPELLASILTADSVPSAVPPPAPPETTPAVETTASTQLHVPEPASPAVRPETPPAAATLLTPAAPAVPAETALLAAAAPAARPTPEGERRRPAPAAAAPAAPPPSPVPAAAPGDEALAASAALLPRARERAPESAGEGMHERLVAIGWAAGIVLALLVLAAQVVDHKRDDLAANARLNRPLTALYAALGVHLVPRWDLRAYDVRQLGASVDPGSTGLITVRASIKNGAPQPQPLPLLRVTLQDRFGNRIAARDVAPPSYLPRAVPAAAFLSAGQRIDAEMGFVDPGANAVGFEIDACLPTAAGEVSCANDAAAR
jgi:predicted Zn finger-like uncharacterized protein